MHGNLLKIKAIVAAIAACSSLAMTAAHAESAKLDGPLTLVVGYAPGGTSDRTARIVSQELQHKLGVSVIVENKTGAGGRIAAAYVKATPAGKNVLLLGNPAVMVVAPLVYKQLNYDPVKDFKPVSIVTKYGFGVAVAATNPIKNLSQLIEWAKAHPKEFNVGVPATGSLPHFFALMLAGKIGIKGQVIGYRGSAPVMTDLIGNSIPVAIDTLDVQTPQHVGGKIRILATSGAKREIRTPDVPTFTQAGVGLEAFGWNAFFAPATMPDAKVKILSRAIMDTLSTPSVQKILEQNDLVPVVAGAAETRKMVDAFRKQWAPVVESSGYVVEK
ncbi:ABC transporter substrate-binding protein [Paralcaligenes sp. KSB-10]|jgi:tripartite-type tricarboxylate transporter receptor subunit TctC|uniref:tripartite tricarboxylate transporter substrate-binding protein n=1 Tax=Paralcaligenes sp. KSB-10 TaxID=2901142 RepID=UPI001E547B9B|nr:tripartite tricarboxylate transporter substrate-binding protein [Paralcaligenes sp. KSB-10]UHL65365.1 ABC transporter substrate-binding protein [Paralcaligenes sp. KSB-10]